ncbi:MAG: hypothetical protein OEW08_12720 [Gammaproteobacteria bacterium]|nr:hypothetical protein [Gammaproteobacteria bacterium]
MSNNFRWLLLVVWLLFFNSEASGNLNEGISFLSNEEGARLSIYFENNIPQSEWGEVVKYLANPNELLFEFILLINAHREAFSRLDKAVFIEIESDKIIHLNVYEVTIKKSHIHKKFEFSRDGKAVLKAIICEQISVKNCFDGLSETKSVVVYGKNKEGIDRYIERDMVGLITFAAIDTDVRIYLISPPSDSFGEYKKITIERGGMEKYFPRIQ